MRPSLLFAVLCLTGCASLRGKEATTVTNTLGAASAYWFRGTPLSLEPVMQGDLVVSAPLATGGAITFTTWYNGQLTNRTGDALFPDGNGGQITEIDMVLDYSQTFGCVKLAGGGIDYAYPQVRESTKEFYLGATLDVLGLTHTLTAYYDLDLLDDYYLGFQASRAFRWNERWSGALALGLGYMGDDQAAFHFGTEEAGLSDLLLSATVNFAFDENCALYLEVAGVTVPDDDLADSLSSNGFDATGAWIGLGLAWGM